MKQSEVARLIQKSAPFVSQLCSGVRKPSVDTVAVIAAELRLEDAEIGASIRELCPEPFARASGKSTASTDAA